MSGLIEGEPIGISSHRVEAGGRLTIPQRVRPMLGPSFAVMPSPNGCLMLMPEKLYRQAIDNWRAKTSLFDPDAAVLDRFFVGNADVVALDRQGRIVISPELRQITRLHGDVKILALRDRVEVWDAVVYDEHMRSLTPELVQFALNRKFGFQTPPAPAPEDHAEAGG